MRPRRRLPVAPLWQRLLAFTVAATVLFASPPLWATVLLTSAAIGVIFAGPVVTVRRLRARASAVEPGAATVLGSDQQGAPFALTDGQLEAHTVIVGASGSGKTTTLLRILTDQILGGKGVVAIDLKGSPSLAAQLAGAAEQAGIPFRLWTPDGPSTWNPLTCGNATELKDKLISMEQFSEIHYQRAAERYLQNALQVLQAVSSPDRPPTLEDVVAVMNPSRLEGMLRHVPPELANRVHSYLNDELTPDQLSGIRGFATRLAIITESHTGRYLSVPSAAASIDLRAALRGEQVVVFSLNSSSYGKLAAQLGALAIEDLITVAGERQSDVGLRHPAIVAIDEFSALENGQLLAKLQQRCREPGIGVIVSSQEPTDFDRAAPGLLKQIMGSTAVKIAHRLDVPGSAQLIADIAGTETVWEETHQVDHHPLFGARASGRSTARQVERYLVHPNVIKSLPTGHAVVVTKVPETRVRIVRVNPPGVPPGPRAPTTDRQGGEDFPPRDRAVKRSASERGRRIGRAQPRSAPRRQLPAPRARAR